MTDRYSKVILRRGNPPTNGISLGGYLTQPASNAGDPNFATVGLALADFVDNCTYYLNGFFPGDTVVRISYPVYPPGSFPPEPTVLYLASLGGFYAQFDYSISVYFYNYTVYTVNHPEGIDFQEVAIQGSPPAAPPPPPPADVTIQLKRDADTEGTYSVKPSDASVLPKYANPVKKIRAKFATTRVAIIEDSVGGGFIVYEEVANVPSGVMYVYNGQRRLTEIVDVAYINQYKAS